jgi:hypothetical protein
MRIWACIVAVACLVLCRCSIAQQLQQQQQQQCSLADNLVAELRGQLSKEALVLLPFTAAYRCA